MAYFKLGAKAKGGQFYDPTTGVHITDGEVKELTQAEEMATKVAAAIAGGHIMQTTAPPSMLKANMGKTKKKSKAELEEEEKAQALLEEQIKYLEDNFTLTEGDKAAFIGLTPEERASYIKEAREEASDN